VFMSRSLKIIIFDGSFKTTPFINRLVQGLSEKHEIYILGFNENVSKRLKNVVYVPLGSNQKRVRFVYSSLGFGFRKEGLKGLFKTLRHIFKGERKLLQQENLNFALEQIKPDIIHLQWPSVLPWFEEVLLNQEVAVVLSQRGFHSNVRPFVNEANFDYLQQWFPKISGFHSVSKAISAKGDTIYKSANKIDRVVYTGLSLANLKFYKEYQPQERLTILSVGRSHWIKGYDYALQSCKLLKDEGLDFSYTIIGGAGDEELQFLIYDLGLADTVVLKGRMPQQEVFDCMKNSSVLLMPSIEEGIPNVVVESMALGLPVISTNCGGVSELISNGKNGWVVPVRDPRAMADAIRMFSQTTVEDILAIREAARKKVEVQHTEEQMVKGMEGLYYEVRNTI